MKNPALIFFASAFVVFGISKWLDWSYLIPTIYIGTGLLFFAYKMLKK